MLTQKSTIAKTKHGKIIQFTNEHYLRNDISCGLTSCMQCRKKKRVSFDEARFPQEQPTYPVSTATQKDDKVEQTLVELLINFDFTFVLEKYVQDYEVTDIANDTHYNKLKQFIEQFQIVLKDQMVSAQMTKSNVSIALIPEMSVFLEQFDLFEQQVPIFGNLIILQSILQYCQKKHNKLYQRLRGLCNASTFQTSLLLKSNFSSKSTSVLNNDNTAQGITTMTPRTYVFNDLHHSQIYKSSTKTMPFAGCELYMPTGSKPTTTTTNKLTNPTPSDIKPIDEDEEFEMNPFVEIYDEYPASTTDEMGDNIVEQDDDKNDPISLEQQQLIDFVTSTIHWYQIHLKTLNQSTPLKQYNTTATTTMTNQDDNDLQNEEKHFSLILGLTNDLDSSLKHLQQGILTMPLELYVAVYTQLYPSLPTLLSKIQEEKRKENSREQIVYKPHLSPTQIETGLQSGALFMGKLMLDRDYWTQGSISTEQYGRVMIPGLKNMNRAFDGDTVAVKIFPRDQWVAAGTELAPNEAIEDKNNYFPDANLSAINTENIDRLDIGSSLADDILDIKTSDEDDFDLQKAKTSTTSTSATTTQRNVLPTGEIVGIIQQGNRVFCGSIEKTTKDTGDVVFLPINKRIPKCVVQSKQIQQIVGSRLLVRYDAWPATSRFPKGHITRVLGNIGDNEAETEMILIEHDIKHDAWSIDVERCLPGPDYVIDDQERAGRVDLRGVDICSIDPPGCTDIDDALHCVKLPNGNYEVGVHIADVTHYMKPGSALDMEASKRSTSVYLVDRRIDMIPARLSTNLCSLHEHVERLAFSTVWELNDDAEIVNTKFFKSVILSRGALTYAQAQERIDLQPEHCTTPELKTLYDDKLTQPCKLLMYLAKKIKARRIRNGALTLASSEVKFKLNQDRTQAEDLAIYQLKDANSLVEEFMLLANVSVAEQILRYFPLSALLRGHPVPPEEMLQPLVKAAKSWGYDVDITSGKALSDSLDKIVDADNPMFNKVLRILTTRCMTQAKYMSSGEIASLKQLHHFGLACNTYTHFTSPIRRYADVIAHRLLATSIGIAPLPEQIKDKAHMRDVVENLNFRHKQAQLASRASTDVWILKYFGTKQEEIVADALVLAVKSTGVRAIVQQFGIEVAVKLIPAEYTKRVETVNFKTPEDNTNLTPAQGYYYNPDLMTLTINGEQIKVLQKLKVKFCVKENRNRRRWLHVELAEESRHLLTTDLIQMLYNEVIEECTPLKMSPLDQQVAAATTTTITTTTTDQDGTVIDTSIVKGTDGKPVDTELFRPMPSFADEEELKQIEKINKTQNNNTNNKQKKQNNNNKGTTITNEDLDVEHVNKKRKPNNNNKKK